MFTPAASKTAFDVAGLAVPWPRIENFVGLLAHDLRNGLNAIELQLTLIGEITQEAETKAEVKRMRLALADLTCQLQAIRTSTVTPNAHLFPYPASDFFEDLRARFEGRHTDAVKRVEWSAEVGSAAVNVDPELLLAALLELLDNALSFSASDSSVAIRAGVTSASLVLTVEQALRNEPSTPLVEWGRMPLLSSRRGGYGLGVFRARRLIELQGGALHFAYSASAHMLTTTVELPLVASGTVVE